MKALLVQIKTYENEFLENEVKTFFEQKGGEVLIETYDLQNLKAIPSKLLALSNSFDYMIGIGLAGFFVLAETNSNAKIVINPCMTPSDLPGLSAESQTRLRQLEEKTYSWADAEMRVATYGIFTKEADVRDKDVFMKVYGRDVGGRDNYCLDVDGVLCGLDDAVGYFNHCNC